MPRAKAKAPAKARSRKAPATGRSRSRKKKNVVSVDFEGVESSSRGAPDGTYLAKPHKFEEKESEAGNDMIVFQWKLVKGITKGSKKGEGAVVFDNISLTPQALWRFKGMLESLGDDIPESNYDVDLDGLIAEDGPECLVEITNEEWEGKERPKITGFLKSDDEEDEEEEEDDEEEEEDDEEEGEDEEEDEDEDEEEEEPPKRSRRKKKEPAAKKKTRARKIRVGSSVKWEDEDGEEVRGVITEIDGDDVTATDAADEEWELEMSEVSAA